MTTVNSFSQQAKAAVLCAIAQQLPDFQQFCEQYQNYISTDTPLPSGLVDNVVTVVESDPKTRIKIRCFAENVQATETFAVSGLTGASFLLTALFLLSTHLKFHRTPDGKWEFLVEHTAAQGEILEKIVGILTQILNK